MIPSRHRRRVLLRRVQSTSNSPCSRRRQWDRRYSSRDSRVYSRRHRGCGGDGRGRMEFVMPFHLLGTNKTVRTGLTKSTACAAYFRIPAQARVGELTRRIGVRVATWDRWSGSQCLSFGNGRAVRKAFETAS